jgi:hypothetical protein
MENRRWVNPTQPQTLQIAVFLLYFNAFFALLGFLRGFHLPVILFTIIGGVLGGYGIANERKWGYGLGLATAFVPFADRFFIGVGILDTGLLNLMFEIALVALLLHPQSRDYQRIWFK